MKNKLYDVIEQIELVKKKLNYLNTKNIKVINQFFSIINNANDNQILTFVDNLILWKDLKYVLNFSIGDWENKKIHIKEKDHKKGKNPIVQVYNGTKNFIDSSNDVIINLSKAGDIEIINLNKIDFAGKIIIL
tara:strand:+ start:1172 stop:1570 length:399 start_codon:yes stop_codon:yes gene_type:complete